MLLSLLHLPGHSPRPVYPPFPCPSAPSVRPSAHSSASSTPVLAALPSPQAHPKCGKWPFLMFLWPLRSPTSAICSRVQYRGP